MKPLFVFLLISLFAFVSCKVKTRDELIVGTWKLDIEATKKGLPPGKNSPVLEGNSEEIKIIFFKDMTTQILRRSTGDMRENKNGSYKLVHDGKYLDVTEQGREKTDETEIVELTGTTMRLRIPDSTIIVFARVKSGG